MNELNFQILDRSEDTS